MSLRNCSYRALAFVVAFVLAGVGRGQNPPTQPASQPIDKAALLAKDVTQGALRIVQPDGNVIECPLKHTDVKADIAGLVARVKVTQTFTNPTKEKIEAVYVFPLSHEAAVDDMTMVIGQRKIVGIIKRRAEARAIYERALAAGQTAALLEQERPNIFTQSVGNIEPGQDINIEIAYVDVLKYDVGSYEFHFPVVVGPRYNPGAPLTSPPPVGAEQVGKVAPQAADTTRVPDASRISPPYMKPEFRNGHDISLSVSLNAGVPIQDLKSANHQAHIERDANNPAIANIAIDGQDKLPNKDFILRYAVVGKKPEMAMLAHTGEKEGSGYFMLMVQPKEDERLTKSPPREIVFLVDVSGSMSGAPTNKNIECMQKMLGLCREDKDTVQVLTFANQATKLFEKPLPVNQKNIDRACDFSAGLQGGGGTEMLKGIQLAIDEPLDPERVRIVIMLTDGFIGNEKEIIEYVGKHCGDKVRFWCIGIGQAPNMFLVDGVAKQGGGMGKKLGLNDDSAAMSQEVMTRIQRAQLAKVKIDWGDMKVSETYPAQLPELWAGRPVIVFGRYAGGGKETAITLSGEVEGAPASWPLKINLPAREVKNEALAKVWARQKIEDLMQQTYYGGSPEVEELVTNIALDYRLMSQYTSFVAVDEKEVGKSDEQARPPRRMMVPVPIPEGTRFEGFFGGEEGEKADKDLFVVHSGGVLDPASAMHGPSPVMPSSSPQPGRFSGVDGKQTRYIELYRQGHAEGRTLRVARTGDGWGVGGGAAIPMEKLQQNGSGTLALNAGGKIYDVRDLSFDAPDTAYRWRPWSATTQPAADAGTQALAAAKEIEKQGGIEAARIAYTRAYFLDSAAVNFGRSNGQAAAEALAALESLREKVIKDVAELNVKLDIVIRDKSVAEALAMVSQRGTGVPPVAPIELLPGSVEDAAGLLHPKELRITYLDLRHATVAQALDWICQPNRLSWWATKSKIVVGTDRRRPGESAWVYDVSLIAIPEAKEFEKLDEKAKAEAAGKSAEQFMAAIKAGLKPKGDTDLVWFAPGQVLVIGDAQLQASAAGLFQMLAGPGPDGRWPTKELTDIAQITQQRAANRNDAAAKADAARELARVAAVHEEFGWKLLAAAVGGQVDDEAMTELTIAWKAPQTAELLKGKSAALVMRSAWQVLESRRSVPLEEGEPLTTLAKAVTATIAPMVEKGVDYLDKGAFSVQEKDAGNPVVRHYVTTLYGVLAERDPKLAGQFLKGTDRDLWKQLGALSTLGRALLDEPKSIDRAALAELIKSGVQGDDMTVLLALACRRAGGETWEAFRANSKQLLGGQPLDGAVVVLINRLSTTKLPLVAEK